MSKPKQKSQKEHKAELNAKFHKLVMGLNNLDVTPKLNAEYQIQDLPYNEICKLNELLLCVHYHIKSITETTPSHEMQKGYSTFDETLSTFYKKSQKQIIALSDKHQLDEFISDNIVEKEPVKANEITGLLIPDLYDHNHLLAHIAKYLDTATGINIIDGYKSLDESLANFLHKCGKQTIAISNENQLSPENTSHSIIPKISAKKETKDTKDNKDLKDLMKEIKELKSGHDRLMKSAEETQKYFKQIQDSLKHIPTTDLFNMQIFSIKELSQSLNSDLVDIQSQVGDIQTKTLQNEAKLTAVNNCINEISARIDGKIDLSDAHRVLEYRSMLEAHIEASVIADMSKQILLPLAALKHAVNEGQIDAIEGAIASLEERCKKAGLSIE